MDYEILLVNRMKRFAKQEVALAPCVVFRSPAHLKLRDEELKLHIIHRRDGFLEMNAELRERNCVFQKLVFDLASLPPEMNLFDALLAKHVSPLSVQVVGDLWRGFPDLYVGLSSSDEAVMVEIAQPPPRTLDRSIVREQQFVNLTSPEVTKAIERPKNFHIPIGEMKGDRFWIAFVFGASLRGQNLAPLRHHPR